MKLTGDLKKQGEKAESKDEMKEPTEKGWVMLTDDELEMVSGGVGGAGGIDICPLYRNETSDHEMDGLAFHTKIDGLTSKDGVDRELLEMQFAMGQYNGKLESMSSVTKRLQEIHRELNG